MIGTRAHGMSIREPTSYGVIDDVSLQSKCFALHRLVEALRVNGAVRWQFIVVGVDYQRSKHLRRRKNIVGKDRKDDDSIGLSRIVYAEEVSSLHGEVFAQGDLVDSHGGCGYRDAVFKYEDGVVQLTPDAHVEVALWWSAEVGDVGQETVASEAIVEHEIRLRVFETR